MNNTVAVGARLFAATILALALAQPGEAGPAQVPAGTGQPSADEQALRGIDRRLLEAATKGDRPFFDDLMADDALITDRNGKVTTKSDALKTFQPLPDLTFALTREDLRVVIHGDTAVVSARSVGTVQAGSQTIMVDERTTDMYARIAGRWRLVAGHTSDIPAARTAVTIDPTVYGAYVGEYQLTPAVVLMVTNEGGRLMAQAMSLGKPSGPKSELLPSSETTFFTQGQAGDTVFVRNKAGLVTHLVIRGGPQEITVAKVK